MGGGVSDLERSLAISGDRSFIYSPHVVPIRAAALVKRLMSLSRQDALRLMLNIVDPTGLKELHLAARDWGGTLSDADRETHKFIRDTAKELRGFIIRRAELLATHPVLSQRTKAELRYWEAERALLERMGLLKGREAQRMDHQRRLLKFCGVAVDIETYPADNKAREPAEEGLETLVRRRQVDALNDHTIGMPPMGVPTKLREEFVEVANKIANTGLFVHEPGSTHPVSWVRSVRFFGHALEGGSTYDSAFCFGSDYTPLADLRKRQFVERLGNFPSYMAPQGCVVFEGCSLGETKEHAAPFLGAIAKLFFGTKPGYVRGNMGKTDNTAQDPLLGLPPSKPLTLRWPDDFH